jgi:pimeloyl-ACP methyl ester carboxylesterase
MVSGDKFKPVIGRFANRYRVIVPDLRGLGRSRGLPPPYTAERLAADRSRLLDHLGLESTAVLDYSQGGAIAQQLVLDHLTRCDRLVLACTYSLNLATVREQLEGHLLSLLVRALGMRRFTKLVVWKGAKELGKEPAEWRTSLMADQDRQRMVAAWKETMAFDSRRRLTDIACPTLVVAGSNDRAVPMHHAAMLHAGIPRSQLAAVDGATHSLIWTHPDELVRVTDAFRAAAG